MSFSTFENIIIKQTLHIPPNKLYFFKKNL